MYSDKLQYVFDLTTKSICPDLKEKHLSKFRILLLETVDWVEDDFEDDLGRKAKKDRVTMMMMRMEMMTIALMPITGHQCCIGGG